MVGNAVGPGVVGFEVGLPSDCGVIGDVDGGHEIGGRVPVIGDAVVGLDVDGEFDGASVGGVAYGDQVGGPLRLSRHPLRRSAVRS